MTTAASQFTPADRELISNAVADAESRTLAEIVPVVATSSGRYDRSEDLFGLFLGLVFLAFVWVWFQGVVDDPQGWGRPTISVGLGMSLLSLLAGYAIGVMLATRFANLRRVFIPRARMIANTVDRAGQAFYDRRVHHTNAEAGVLIYISLFERQAVILTDENAYEALGQQAIDDHCRALTRSLRKDPPSKALPDCIAALASTLASSLPGSARDANDLPDALITID